jgi:hypothetical protein
MTSMLAALQFQIDHVRAQKHGGVSALDNLALSCFACNSYKGPNIAGIDPMTGRSTRLFHPRRDRWTSHFEWNGAILVGRSRIGRATIHVLNMNHPDVVSIRDTLIAARIFPPAPRP